MELERYISSLRLEGGGGFRSAADSRGASGVADPLAPTSAAARGEADAAVNGSAIVAFAPGLDARDRQDVLESVQLAQRAASGLFDRFDATKPWFEKFIEVLERVGWVTTAVARTDQSQAEGRIRLDVEAIKVLAQLASEGALGILTQALSALENAADRDGAVTLFERYATLHGSGNFQVGAVDRKEGSLSMAVGAFRFSAEDRRQKTLFLNWGKNEIGFWSSARKMQLNGEQYSRARPLVKSKLGDPADYLEALGPLG